LEEDKGKNSEDQKGDVMPDGDAHGMVVLEFFHDEEVEGKAESAQKGKYDSSVLRPATEFCCSQ